MSDGSWTIKQWNPNSDRHKVEKIRVWHDPEVDALVPKLVDSPAALILHWPDGHTDMYPWCSIVKAEYVPPTKDNEWPVPGDLIG